MPTPLPPTEKAAFIALTRLAPYPGGPNEADRLQTILNNYQDVYTAIMRQLDLFQSNNSYLIQSITSFDQLQLQAVGIYVNQAIPSPPLVDPVLIINSTYGQVKLNEPSPPGYKGLVILGSSVVSLIKLTAGTTLNELYIGPGAKVDLHDGSLIVASPPASPPTVTEVIYLPFEKSTPSTLNTVEFDSVVNQVIVSPGSYYGGVRSNDPDLSCADVVTGVTATEITKNSVYVSWTPPASYLFINVSYRKTNSKPWIPVNEVIGDYNGDTGFTFRNLDSDSWYDVRISVTCINGATASNDVTFQTTCCGAGSQMSIYKFCQLKMLIGATPSPPVYQTLCNGITIDLYYPAGPTLTVPYLGTVNAALVTDMVIDNATYQNMPYNPAIGQWNASTTPVLEFVDGNTVTIGVSLPA